MWDHCQVCSSLAFRYICLTFESRERRCQVQVEADRLLRGNYNLDFLGVTLDTSVVVSTQPKWV
jgi:hypothetical protein